jgi:threonine/homoserine/homoserine lactone efflux protein
MLLYFLQGVTFGFAAAVQPGPFQTYLISQTLSNGWRRTLPAVLAPLLSDMPILALVLLVLSHISETAIQILHLAGGAFILYLAFGAFKAWQRFDPQRPAPQSSQQSLFKAAFVNLLNPNPYLFWSLVGGPLFLTAWRETPLNGIGYLLGFYITIIGSMAVGVVLLSVTGRFGAKVNRVLLGISALALFGMGLYQIWLGIIGILK